MEAMRVILDAVADQQSMFECVDDTRHGCHVLYDVLCEPSLYIDSSASLCCLCVVLVHICSVHI
jgi:hypothetical protein